MWVQKSQCTTHLNHITISRKTLVGLSPYLRVSKRSPTWWCTVTNIVPKNSHGYGRSIYEVLFMTSNHILLCMVLNKVPTFAIRNFLDDVYSGNSFPFHDSCICKLYAKTSRRECREIPYATDLSK